MNRTHRRRIATTLLLVALVVAGLVAQDPGSWLPAAQPSSQVGQETKQRLDSLAVKGRAPKTGYARAQFGDGWEKTAGCDTRNIILARDLRGEAVGSECKVMSGTLHDPYTGKTIEFRRGSGTSTLVQIDHVVALSDAWQKGAQSLAYAHRVAFANDPLNLLAVDGPANQQKSDGDAATWLPPNKAFRCQYVERQVKVKQKYALWVTAAEKTAMERVLGVC